MLQDTDGLPITRVLRGTRFALGLLWAAGNVARELSFDEEAAAARGKVIEDLAAHLDSAGYRGSTACAAAGITYRQLDYWARLGLLEPSLRNETGSTRLYSPRDVMVLKVIKRLLDSGLSITKIHAAVIHLRDTEVGELEQVTLMSDGASVYECTSPDEVYDLLAGGQGVFGIALGRVQQEIRGELAQLPKVKIDTGKIAGAEKKATLSGSGAYFLRRETPVLRWHLSK